jgi:mono/diheme cytochrome c family protein
MACGLAPLTAHAARTKVVATLGLIPGENDVKAFHVARATFTTMVSGACLALTIHGANAAMNHRGFSDVKNGSLTSSAVTRGKYLVTFGSCTDCHTPGNFFGKPDMTKFLGGSDVGFAIPGLGVFVGPNLTPDKQTGLGNWTDAQIVTALTTGKTPEGRTLAPAMPWHAYANLTKSDALAIVAYLKSLPPVSHQVGGPYGPNQAPAEAVMVVIPPAVYNGLPKPGGPAPDASPAPAPAAPATPGK